MTALNHTPRLYIEADLQLRQPVSVSADQAHYLQHVMRMRSGDVIRLFNGRDGEWRGEIGVISKRSLEIRIIEQLKPQTTAPDLWLCCAPIKKTHFDFLIEKATELGVSTIQPILTARTQVREVNVERVHALTIEAAEQSERLSIPVIHKPVLFKDLAKRWPDSHTPVVCAELGEAKAAREAFEQYIGKNIKAAIVTGPEGGFETSELDQLRQLNNALFIRLGPRILRADTAAIAALCCWQAICGDWDRDSATKKTS